MNHRIFVETGVEHNSLIGALIERSKAPFAKAAKVSNVRCENRDFIFSGVGGSRKREHQTNQTKVYDFFHGNPKQLSIDKIKTRFQLFSCLV